jgi:hypothetical protein
VDGGRTLDAARTNELADELDPVLWQANAGRVVPLLAPGADRERSRSAATPKGPGRIAVRDAHVAGKHDAVLVILLLTKAVEGVVLLFLIILLVLGLGGSR